MKVKIGIFSVMLFLSLLIFHSYFALSSLIAVVLHELGHIFAANCLKIDLSECKIDIFGASLSPASYNFSYKDEIILCICGPVSNFLTSLFALPFWFISKNEIILYFILASIALALMNLIPIKGFDGGRIFHALLCLIYDEGIAEKLLNAVSFVCILFLWLISVYLLLIARSNLSLFIFSISLFLKIFIKEN